MKVLYISVTRVPEQVMPFQDCPHGSSPLAGQPSWGGEFKLWNIAFTEATAWNIREWFDLARIGYGVSKH